MGSGPFRVRSEIREVLWPLFESLLVRIFDNLDLLPLDLDSLGLDLLLALRFFQIDLFPFAFFFIEPTRWEVHLLLSLDLLILLFT